MIKGQWADGLGYCGKRDQTDGIRGTTGKMDSFGCFTSENKQQKDPPNSLQAADLRSIGRPFHRLVHTATDIQYHHHGNPFRWEPGPFIGTAWTGASGDQQQTHSHSAPQSNPTADPGPATA
jgi:hypothetical protein